MAKSIVPMMLMVSLSLLIWAPVSQGRTLEYTSEYMPVSYSATYYPAALINSEMDKAVCLHGCECCQPGRVNCKKMDCCGVVECPYPKKPYGQCDFKLLTCTCDKCGGGGGK